MNQTDLEEIRHELNLVFPHGGYTLKWQPGEPLRLTWDKGVHENTKRFSVEILRLYKVPFETGGIPAN